jgi:hypothetical protein
MRLKATTTPMATAGRSLLRAVMTETLAPLKRSRARERRIPTWLAGPEVYAQ